MKFRPKSKLVCTGPGPYPIAHHLTHRGFELPPAYTIGVQSSKKRKFNCLMFILFHLK